MNHDHNHDERGGVSRRRVLVMQKVEGNVTFHTAHSTAFLQPAPGAAPSPGPMKVGDSKLRSVLGIASVNFKLGDEHLAIIDTPLQG